MIYTKSTYVCLDCNAYWNIAGGVEYSKGPIDHSHALRHEVMCLDKFLTRPLLPTYLVLTEDEKARLAEATYSYNLESDRVKTKIKRDTLTSDDALTLKSAYSDLESVIKSILGAHAVKKKFRYRY